MRHSWISIAKKARLVFFQMLRAYNFSNKAVFVVKKHAV